MKAELSALMDDALDEQELAVLLDQLVKDGGLQQTWETYHLLGDALRQDASAPLGPAPGFAARCMAALETEPTVLAPHARRVEQPSPWRFTLPVAASLMGVVAVAWVAEVMLPPGGAVVMAVRSTSAPQTLVAEGEKLRAAGRGPETVSLAGAPVYRSVGRHGVEQGCHEVGHGFAGAWLEGARYPRTRTVGTER